MSSLSMPMPLVSGFVAFDDAPRARASRPSAPPPAAVEPEVVAREGAVAPVDVASPGLLQSPSWSPVSSGRVRTVEGIVIAALCGWFLYGGLAVLGWI